MDRNRLKEVHQSDLTEGRINQDFLDWLQTKGMTWLLVALVALCAYFGIVRWRHHRTSYQTEAWQALANAKLPGAYEDVAEKYADVGAVPFLARLQAAEELLKAVQVGKALGAETETRKDLTPQDRDDYLNRADRLYVKVVENDDKSSERALIIATALSGRAAVAESKGDLDQAKQYYLQAAERTAGVYPKVSENARARAESVDAQAKPATLPTSSQLAATFAVNPKPAEPVTLDGWVRDLVMPATP
jgi:hypothetical protein